MKLGLSVVAFNWPGYPENIGEKLAQIGKATDKAGFDSLWVMDHFFQMDGPRLGNVNIEYFTELVLADLQQDAPEILEMLETEDPQ